MNNHKLITTVQPYCLNFQLTQVRTLSVFSLAFLSMLLTAAPSMAQDIDEIIVVGEDIGNLSLSTVTKAASRLGLTAMDTPGSVELITREEIALKGDHTALSAVTRSTGIVSSATPGNGSTSVTSRGFNGHGAVANTYDGTRLYVGAGTVTFPADTWTLDRVEILRGPGAVVNGIGATGATINYVPKSPILGNTATDLLLSAGSFGEQRIGVGVNIDLSDTAAMRIDAVNHHTDGYVDRAEENRKVAAASVLVQPNELLSLRFSLDYANIEDAPYWGTPLINGDADKAVRKNNYNVADGIVEYDDLWPRLHLQWRLSDNVTFRNDTYLIDAERHWRNVETYEFDGIDQIDRSFYLEILHDQEQTGTRSDFLISSNLGDMKNKMSLGAEFNQVEFEHRNNRPFGGVTSVPLDGYDPGLFLQVDPTTLDFMTDMDQYAIFIDDVLDLNEQWSLVVGGRYDSIDFQRQDAARSNGETAGAFDADFAEFSWRVGVVFQPSDNLSFYGQASTGPDSLGSLASLNVGQQELDLTKGQQLEVGVKQFFWQGRGEYTLALFDISKKDLFTQTNAASAVEQVGEQTAKGLEITVGLRVTDNLALDMNLARVDAEYKDFVGRSGNTPRNTPDMTSNLWAVWSASRSLRITGGLRYVDKRFSDDGNTQVLPDYLVFDASMNWNISENIAATLRGRNLTDEEDYVLSSYGSTQWIFADPRSYELSIDLSF